MTKLFFDHLVSLKDVEKQIKKYSESPEEKEELWGLVDEIVHHKVLESILDKLPLNFHTEFLEMFHKSPHDEGLIIGYLKSKISENIEDILKEELGELAYSLLGEISSSKKVKVKRKK